MCAPTFLLPNMAHSFLVELRSPLTTVHYQYESYLPSSFGRYAFWFEAIFKMLGKAIFEVIEVKGDLMVKEQNFEAKKNQN